MHSTSFFPDYSTFLARHLQGKIQKLSIDGGFGCPNRDGTVGRGGCTYCNNQSFTPSYCKSSDSVRRQLELGKEFFGRKYPGMHYLAYFQSHTNTYAPLQVLLHKYEEALEVDGVVGLVIGTRPDCVSDELLNQLERWSRSAFILIEYGIESTDDARLGEIHRGHTFAQTRDAFERTAAHGLFSAGHVILGLPGDTEETLLQQPAILSSLPLNILKLHQLQIIRDTPMAQLYATSPDRFPLLFHSPQSYAELVCRYLQRLRPDIVMERFTSQTPPALLIAPRWGMKNYEFVAMLKKLMTARRAFQGQLYQRILE